MSHRPFSISMRDCVRPPGRPLRHALDARLARRGGAGVAPRPRHRRCRRRSPAEGRRRDTLVAFGRRRRRGAARNAPGRSSRSARSRRSARSGRSVRSDGRRRAPGVRHARALAARSPSGDCGRGAAPDAARRRRRRHRPAIVGAGVSSSPSRSSSSRGRRWFCSSKRDAAVLEHAEIMIGELEVIFGLHAVAGKLRVARQALYFSSSWAALPRWRLSWRLPSGRPEIPWGRCPPRPRRRPPWRLLIKSYVPCRTGLRTVANALKILPLLGSDGPAAVTGPRKPCASRPSLAVRCP